MHLSSYQLNRYRHAGLAPTELLAIDDHLVTCEFCRQQLRPGINWPAAIHQLRANLLLLPEEDHVAPEQRTAFVHNRLDAIERELVTSHLQGCPDCTAQTQFLRAGTTDAIPTFGAMWANVMGFLQERAVLIWPMPVVALLVVVTVTIADYWYHRQRAKPAAPTITQPIAAPATPAPLPSPQQQERWPVGGKLVSGF